MSSEKLAINAGVPQGSVLCPTLFPLHQRLQAKFKQTPSALLMTQHSHSAHIKSQSESALLLEEKSAASAAILNDDLASIAEWGKEWLVAFNPSKTQTINISIKHSKELPPLIMSDVQLECAGSLHLPGMDVSYKLSCHLHCQTCITSHL